MRWESVWKVDVCRKRGGFVVGDQRAMRKDESALRLDRLKNEGGKEKRGRCDRGKTMLEGEEEVKMDRDIMAKMVRGK